MRFLNIKSLNKKIFSNWTDIIQPDLCRPDLLIYDHELFQWKICSITQQGEHEKFQIDPDFRESLKKIFNQGYTQFLQAYNDLNKEEVEQIDQISIVNWKSLYGRIAKQNFIANNQNSGNNIVRVLREAGLINQVQSDKITQQGFKFILSKAHNQILTFISYYSEFMIRQGLQKGIQPSDIVNFIINLSLLYPKKLYFKNQLKPFQLEIIQDFIQVGLIWQSTYDPNLITCTRLLHNFMFQETELGVDIKCDIIVETNFRVYIYLNEQQEEEHIFDLVSKFTDIKYRFRHMIVCELSQEKVVKAYNDNITADLIIDFFNKCVSQAKIQYDIRKKQNIENQQIDTAQVKKQGLEFLKLYNSKEDSGHIPANIVQTLRLWEKEKHIDYREAQKQVKKDAREDWENQQDKRGKQQDFD